MYEASASEERAFLKAILEQPDDDARKLVYADWLEEQGDPRAEYLRLMVQVRQDRVITPEQRKQHHELSAAFRTLDETVLDHEQVLQKLELIRQLDELSRTLHQKVPDRLRELAAVLDPKWLAVVSDPVIEGCQKNSASNWPLRFDFVCDKSWADMKPTGDEGVRRCDNCAKNVYFCDNLAEARRHSEQRHCIAIDLGVIRREGDLSTHELYLGSPSPSDVRKSYEDDLDPVSQARLDARRPKKRRWWQWWS